MAKASRGKKTNSRSVKKSSQGAREPDPEEVIRAAEKMAMAAFGSGLKLVAAFGAAAAKSASLALESLASGAGKFSQLVTEEALKSQRSSVPRKTQNNMARRIRRTDAK